MAQRTKETAQEFEDLSSYSSAPKRKKRGRRGLVAVQIVLVAVCVLLIAIGSMMIYLSTDLLADLTTNTITKDPEKLGIPIDAELDDSVTNIAIFGVDARNGDFTGKSDIIMILTVDNRHKKLKMSSILRDSKVRIEGQTLTGEAIDWETKINAAYEEGGPELAIRTINQVFSPEGSPLAVRDYVTVNFANMAAIVDAFGGVDVELTAEEAREINRNLWSLSREVEDQMAEDQAEGVFEGESYPVITAEDYIRDEGVPLDIEGGNYTGGVYHLNGNRAVAYARIRSIGNDYARVERQQVVFSLLIEKLMDMGVTDYPALIRQLMPFCETSLGLDDIVGMTPLLLNGFSIETLSVPDKEYEEDIYDGLAEDGVAYVTYDITPAAERLNSFIYEETSPYWEQYGNTGSAPHSAD